MTNKVEDYQLKTPLDEKIFKKFLSDEMTVKEVKGFTETLSKRFSYIVHKIAEITNRKVEWFDYANENGEYSPGEFDTERYKKDVEYTGDFSTKGSDLRFEDYDDYFPTVWFYTNFEVQLKKEKEAFFKSEQRKEEEKLLAKERSQAEFKKVQNNIKKKLTAEELAYIAFLSPEEVRKNKAKVHKAISTDVAKFIKEMKQKGINVSEKYEEYREGKKKPQTFDSWVLKNLNALTESIPKKVVTPQSAWPFPIGLKD